MLFKLSDLALTLGYLNPTLNNSALECITEQVRYNSRTEDSFRCSLV